MGVRFFVIWSLIFKATLLSAYADKDSAFNKGVIIDTVFCKEHKEYSYSLYLPKNYSLMKTHPVLYIFDPGARGRVGISNFIQGSEKFGYILVCSNNSRNGLPLNTTLSIANNLISDVESRCNADTNRIYFAGFSGGSRVASGLACIFNNISGVIGCGAGFSIDEIKKHIHFAYAGIIGKRDMNYFEMLDLKEKLDNALANSILQITDTGHVWPAPNDLEKAMAWLQLQAMKKRVLEMDSSFINEQYKLRIAEESCCEKEGDLLKASIILKDLIRDFAGWKPTMSQQTNLEVMTNSRQYKQLNKLLGKNKNKEIETEQEMLKIYNYVVFANMQIDSFSFLWESKIHSLNRMQKNHDQNKSYMAARILNYLTIFSFENAYYFFSNKQYKQSIEAYKLLVKLQPDNIYPCLFLAKSYSLDGNLNKSLDTLEKCIKLSLKDKKLIENDQAFSCMKGEKRFSILLSKIQ